MPGMEDEPNTTFSNIETLFEKLNISADGEEQGIGSSWRDNQNKSASSKSTTNQQDSTHLTYEERAAQRKAERELRQKEKEKERLVHIWRSVRY